MQLTITTNFPEVQKALDQLGPKARSAVREGINRTLDWAETEVRQEMRQVFDRPVPFTLRSLRKYFASTRTLEGRLWFRQRSADRDKLWAGPQIFGGPRDEKPMEKRLRQLGVLPRGWYVVPGEGAPLDSYGNMSPGEISRILNVLGAYTEAGYNKATDKTRARLRRGTRKTYGFEYFVVRPRNFRRDDRALHLAPGVWRRVYTGFGTALKPMLIFVERTNYKPRLDFERVVRRTVDRHFAAEFAKAWDQLVRTGSASAGRRNRG